MIDIRSVGIRQGGLDCCGVEPAEPSTRLIAALGAEMLSVGGEPLL